MAEASTREEIASWIAYIRGVREGWYLSQWDYLYKTASEGGASDLAISNMAGRYRECIAPATPEMLFVWAHDLDPDESVARFVLGEMNKIFADCVLGLIDPRPGFEP